MSKKRFLVLLTAALLLSCSFTCLVGAADVPTGGSMLTLLGNAAVYVDDALQDAQISNAYKMQSIEYSDGRYSILTTDGLTIDYSGGEPLSLRYTWSSGKEYATISATYMCTYLRDGASAVISLPVTVSYDNGVYSFNMLLTYDKLSFMSGAPGDYQFDLEVRAGSGGAPARSYSDLILPSTATFNGSDRDLISQYAKIRYDSASASYRIYDNSGNYTTVTNGTQITFAVAADAKYNSVAADVKCTYTYNGQSLSTAFPASVAYNQTSQKYIVTVTLYTSKLAFLAREYKDYTLSIVLVGSNATTVTIANTDSFTGFNVAKNETGKKPNCYGKTYVIPADATTVKVYGISWIDDKGLHEPTSVTVYNGGTKVKTYTGFDIDTIYVDASTQQPYYYLAIPVSELADGYSIMINYDITLAEIDTNSESYKAGYEQGQDAGYKKGYDAGYQNGLTDATNTDGWLGFFDGVFGSVIFNAVYVLGGIGFGGISLLDIVVCGLLAIIVVFVVKALMK